jgi:hypothetical protein
MAPEHDTDALEALARGEPVADRAGLDAHLAGCEDCARELAWLRAERHMLRERARDEPSVDRLWGGVAAKLPAATAASPSPYRTAAPVPSRPERLPWRAFAAGFAAAVALGLGAAALTLKVNSRPPPSHRARTPSDARPAVQVETALAVPGPVLLHLETWSADVRVFASAASEIRATVRGVDVDPRITRRPDGRYDLVFGGRRLSSGEVDVLVPRGSSLEASTASGDVTVGEGMGDLRVATTAGDVRALGVRDAEVTTTSGDVTLTSTGARVRLRTVSGNARIAQGAARTVDLETTSGDVAWSGACAQDCRLDARSVSGGVRLALARESGFALRFTTVSGELSDALATGAALPEGGGPATGRYGAGAGAVEVTTTSGSLALTPQVVDGGR